MFNSSNIPLAILETLPTASGGRRRSMHVNPSNITNTTLATIWSSVNASSADLFNNNMGGRSPSINGNGLPPVIGNTESRVKITNSSLSGSNVGVISGVSRPEVSTFSSLPRVVPLARKPAVPYIQHTTNQNSSISLNNGVQIE